MKSLVAALIVLAAGAAPAADLADDWHGTLWRRSDYRGFAMQENWAAAMLEAGDSQAVVTKPPKAAKSSAKATGAVAGNPTGRRVHRKTPIDDGVIPPNVIVPPR